MYRSYIRPILTRHCSETLSKALPTASRAPFWNPLATRLGRRDVFFGDLFPIAFSMVFWVRSAPQKESRNRVGSVSALVWC